MLQRADEGNIYAPTHAPKTIALGEDWGMCDDTDILPLIDTPQVQRLRGLNQLGSVDKIFPLATTSRYAHSLMAVETTTRMLVEMARRRTFEPKQGIFVPSERDVRLARIVALLHDAGHSNFGHGTEHEYAHRINIDNPYTHDQRTVAVVRTLDDRLQERGFSADEVIECLDKKQPSIGRIVTQKPVGAEKLAYLFDDSKKMGIQLGGLRDPRELFTYVSCIDGTIVYGERVAAMLEKVLEWFQSNHMNGYFLKQCLVKERLLQKAIGRFLDVTKIDPDKMAYKKDGWVVTKLEECDDEIVKRLYHNYEYERLGAALVVKCAGYERFENKGKKAMTVVGADREAINACIDRYRNPLQRAAVEHLLCEKLKIPHGDLVMTIVPQIEKLVPEDIGLIDSEGEPAGSVFERNPDLRKEMEEKARRYFAIRVAVRNGYREQVAKRPEALRETIQFQASIDLGYEV